MTTVAPWQMPTGRPAFGDDEIHVWQAPLRVPPESVATFRHSLSADEMARADRFRLPVLRHNFTVARGTLRAILGRYLEADPSRVAFTYSPLGKPGLDLASHQRAGMPPPLHFNLSHSGDLVFCAVALHREVGVDVECHRATRDFEGLVNRFFSTGERAAIDALPDDQKPAAFFKCWTLKEAYLKGRGTGLSFPLDQFEVKFAAGADPTVRDAKGGSLDWTCRELPCPPGYTVAVAAQGASWQVRCWQYA